MTMRYPMPAEWRSRADHHLAHRALLGAERDARELARFQTHFRTALEAMGLRVTRLQGTGVTVERRKRAEWPAENWYWRAWDQAAAAAAAAAAMADERQRDAAEQSGEGSEA